eukprot:4939539-Amphidinium_carterae.1
MTASSMCLTALARNHHPGGKAALRWKSACVRTRHQKTNVPYSGPRRIKWQGQLGDLPTVPGGTGVPGCSNGNTTMFLTLLSLHQDIAPLTQQLDIQTD